MEPFAALTLSLPKRTGGVPKGSYRFTERHCTDPGDDCRGVTIVVLNEKGQEKGVIRFGFDQDDPFAGPYLDPARRQAPYAEALLQLFVDALNGDPQLLERLYRHYREARAEADGKAYRGKPFPKPGTLVYRVKPPPDLQAQMERSLRELGRPAPAAPYGGAAAKRKEPAEAEAEPLDALLARYLEVGTSAPVQAFLSLQGGVRRYLLARPDAAERLAELLPELFQHSPQDDERIEAALRLLFDTLQILQFELDPDVGRPLLERLENALAGRVFDDNEDVDLRIAVSNVIVQSRVEIFPALQEASGRMMIASAGRSDLQDVPGEEIMSGILRSLHSLGVSSPFEGADELLQLFLLNDAELQTALIAEMLAGDSELLREIAALMLFHREPEVRLGVSRALAAGEGGKVSPQTLRRLIVSRNWFPEEMRRNIDLAVANARKARVECAPLPRPDTVTLYAGPVDGSGRQSFRIGVEREGKFARGAIVVQQGVGIVSASAASLQEKRELTRFLAQVKGEPESAECDFELLDLRVSHALQEGLRSDQPPGHWLLRCAELLGRDSWRPVGFDAGRELLLLSEELDPRAGREEAPDPCLELQESADWRDRCSFLSDWLEDEQAVERALSSSRRKKLSADAAAELVADRVMEGRRPLWLERLVWTALWLKGAKRPALPWQKMYRLAQAVLDETVPLKEIPLMRSIAAASAEAYLSRRQGSTTDQGVNR